MRKLSVYFLPIKCGEKAEALLKRWNPSTFGRVAKQWQNSLKLLWIQDFLQTLNTCFEMVEFHHLYLVIAPRCCITHLSIIRIPVFLHQRMQLHQNQNVLNLFPEEFSSFKNASAILSSDDKNVISFEFKTQFDSRTLVAWIHATNTTKTI